MCKWISPFRRLFSFWQLDERETKTPKVQLPAKLKPEGDILPAADDLPYITPLPSDRPPVIVRGKAWYNTAAVERADSGEQRFPGGAEAIESLVNSLLHDSRTENRKVAAEALGRLGAEASKAIPALLETMAHADRGLRHTALAALKEIDPHWHTNEAAQEVILSWCSTLMRGNLGVNTELERHMRQIGLPAVSGMTRALSDSGDAPGKVFILRVVSGMASNALGAVKEVTEALGSQNPQTCIEAARALASIGEFPAPAIQSLAAGLSHWDPDVRRAMASCLIHVGPAAEPAIPALLQLLVDRDDEVCKTAIKALEHIGPAVVPWLVEIVRTRDLSQLLVWLKHVPDASHWRSAIAARDIQAMRNLSWAAYEAEEERIIRENAVVAALQLLGRYGPAATAALPAVDEARGDPNPHIREAATNTWKQINVNFEDDDRCGSEIKT